MSVIVVVPVPDALNVADPLRIRVPVCAPEAIENVEALTLFSLTVEIEPDIETVPLSRLKLPLPLRFVLFATLLVIVMLPEMFSVATVEVKTWV